jgi:hypothetical protein
MIAEPQQLPERLRLRDVPETTTRAARDALRRCASFAVGVFREAPGEIPGAFAHLRWTIPGMGLTGAELSRGFWAEAVAPLLAAEMPRPRYAAGRFGTGSDVLGLDDAMSRDHDWGCRLAVLVDSGECDAVPALRELLARRLPASFRGHPVRFPLSWDSSVSHRAEVATVGEFAADRLGADPVRGLTVLDWLTLTGQSVLEVTAGLVFADDTRELRLVRSLLRWYPPDVERYVLAGGWQRVSQRLPFVGQTADRGDELGSRLLCAGLADDLMWLAFAMSRRWPPYEKWRGVVFRDLPVASSLSDLLLVSVTAGGWREREAALYAGIEVLTSLQRSAGLPAPSSGVVPFHDRPYRGLNDELAAGLLAGVTDPAVAALPAGVGCLERWADSVDVLSSPSRRAGARAAYLAWTSAG